MVCVVKTAGRGDRHDTLRPLFPLPAPPMTTVLTSAQTRFLRGQAHDIKAMLQVGGKGITDTLVAELDNALEQHELVKVKVAGAETASCATR
jgi:RNA-binding protein